MIDSRIEAVMNFVRAGSKVADIGADHGYLSITLAENHLAAKIIATEKNLHPFEALSKNISDAGLDNVIEVRMGDGLKVFSAGEVDTICVAGMGGALITKILDDSPEVVHSARQIIVQPMNAAKKFRDWCAENIWAIVDEDLAEASGIIYEIICAEKGSEPQKIFKREVNPLNRKFIAQRVEKLRRVLDEMSKSPVARASEKFSVTQAEIENLRRIYSCHSNSISPI